MDHVKSKDYIYVLFDELLVCSYEWGLLLKSQEFLRNLAYKFLDFFKTFSRHFPDYFQT